MVIQFNVCGPDNLWNLQMAKMVHLLWETCQLNAINLPYSYATGPYSSYVTLEDYRISGTLI